VPLAGGAPGAHVRASAEDDLTVVRRAVADSRPRPDPGADRARDEGAPVKARKGEPRWLRVRITERGRSRVSVNVPLALARALGDDLPIRWGCRKRCDDDERTRLKLGDVLRSLDSGQDIVQVDSDDATVRVWVE
jgi:hypothetical protein